MASDYDVVFAVLFSIFLVFNVAGNSLVIYIISTNKVRKSATNYLLLNMAVADLVLGIFAIPRYVFPFYSTSNRLNWLCWFMMLTNISWLAAAASSITMLALSLERYYAVCHPLKFRQIFTIRNIKVMIMLSWLYGVLTNVHSFVYNECQEGSHLNPKIRKVFWLLFFIEGVVFFTIISRLVLKIIRTLWCNSVTSSLVSNQPSLEIRHQSRKKVTRASLLVIVTFIICWIPEKSMCLLSVIVDEDSSVFLYGLAISGFLVSVNASVDPYLFSFQGSSFTIYAKKLICCFVRHRVMSNDMNETCTRHIELPADKTSPVV